MPITPLGNAPIPLQDRVSASPREDIIRDGGEDKQAGYLTQPWVEWLNLLAAQVQASPYLQNNVTYTAQTATIAATDFTGGSLTTGLYRLTYYTRITRAATTSSSLTISFTWTDDTVALSLTYAALTGNTVTTGQTNTALVKIDAASPVLITATYASVGATSMEYKLYVGIEAYKTNT